MQRGLFLLLLCFFVAVSYTECASQSPDKSISKPSVSAQSNLSSEFTKLGAVACDAIRQVPFSTVSDNGYAEKKTAAQKAVEAVSQKASTGSDKNIVKVLQAWLALTSKQHDASAQHDTVTFREAGDAGRYCMAEAELAFKTHVLSDQGRQLAAEKKCLAEY
jgi:hypothetical protein